MSEELYEMDYEAIVARSMVLMGSMASREDMLVMLAATSLGRAVSLVGDDPQVFLIMTRLNGLEEEMMGEALVGKKVSASGEYKALVFELMDIIYSPSKLEEYWEILRDPEAYLDKLFSGEDDDLPE